MDASTIQSLVSSLGFPIICCGAFFWLINKTLKELTLSIQQNTAATQKLVTTVELISDFEQKEDSHDG